MHTLLDENFWQGILFEEQFDMQATMFQPVGGMDRIPYAFAKSLGSIVQYESPVSAIRKIAKGVRVEYTHKGESKAIEADYCVCAMPLTILKKTPNDFSDAHKQVIEEATYAHAYKIAWESRRFWEQDYNIYGGLEFVNEGCSPVWFPSAGLFSPRGVLVSGYTDESFGGFERLALAEKLAESRKTIERLHAGHGKELEKPLYVGWGKIPYNEGSWVRSYRGGVPRGVPVPGRMAPDQTQSFSGYETLTQPDGCIYFAGCHVSHIVAWQEGAALSSLRVVQMISDRVSQARLAGGTGKS
jgi:monoamine oxidase